MAEQNAQNQVSTQISKSHIIYSFEDKRFIEYSMNFAKVQYMNELYLIN